MTKKLRLDKIAEMSGGELKGPADHIVGSISEPDRPAPNSISPLWEKKFMPLVKPGTVLLTKRGWMPEGFHGVEVDDPRRFLVDLLRYFDGSMDEPASHTIHETAIIAEDAVIGRDVSIGPGCVVSGGAVIGDGCVLVSGVWIGKGVSVGDATRIEPGAVLYDRISVGKRCLIHANAVIGCDGFGFMPDPSEGLLRIPQIGTVTIEDDVEIGACSNIDRATFGVTHISRGTKIDSLVKIAHNCRIGEYCIIVSQCGIAGSTTLGRGVIMAGQSGAGNHAYIGDGVTVAARAAVVADIPAGQAVSGFPAREHHREMREQAAMMQLPEMLKTIRDLKARVAALESKAG